MSLSEALRRPPGTDPAACAASARGTASRRRSRSFRTRSRRPTRSPTRRSRTTPRRSTASSATCSSRSTSSSLLLEERGEGDLESVARDVHAKLVRRHPHVFGDADARTPGRVRERWEALKTEQEGREGIFHDVPEALPALLQARKVQRRAAAVGYDWPDLAGPLAKVREELAELEERAARAGAPAPETEPDPAVFHELGDLLFTVVNVARRLNVDPELALRATTRRFTERVEAAAELAESRGRGLAQPRSRCAGRLLRTREGDARMTDIAQVHARQLLDSRGNPTLEVDVRLAVRARSAARRSRRARRRASTRRSSCATAIANALPRQGRAEGRRARERRDRGRGRRPRRRRPARARRRARRARRHADEEPPRRERDPRLLARGREGGRGRRRAAALPLARRRRARARCPCRS